MCDAQVPGSYSEEFGFISEEQIQAKTFQRYVGSGLTVEDIVRSDRRFLAIILRIRDGAFCTPFEIQSAYFGAQISSEDYETRLYEYPHKDNTYLAAYFDRALSRLAQDEEFVRSISPEVLAEHPDIAAYGTGRRFELDLPTRDTDAYLKKIRRRLNSTEE